VRRAILAAVVLLAALGIALPRTPFGQRLLYGGPAPLAGQVPAPVPGTVPPSPALKIAFLGDSGAAESFSRVLALVRLERADAVVHLGDAAYEGETAGDFWGMVDRELGPRLSLLPGPGQPRPRALARPCRARPGLTCAKAARSPTAPAWSIRASPWSSAGVSVLFVGESVADDDPRRIVDRYARDPAHLEGLRLAQEPDRHAAGGQGRTAPAGASTSRAGRWAPSSSPATSTRTTAPAPCAAPVEAERRSDLRRARHLCVRPAP
jgi:hypothetical protein